MVSRNCVPALDKGVVIAFALRLAAKHHWDAESVIITWTEHCGLFRMSAPAKLGAQQIEMIVVLGVEQAY